MADRVDIFTEPYFTDSVEGSDISTVLFRADRPLQQRELNTVQAILQQHIGRTNGSVWAEGAPTSGTDWSIDEDNMLNVQRGTVYLEGLVRNFHPQSIQLTLQGEERVGVVISQRRITHEEDPSLRDPTQGENKDAEGAERLEEVVELVLNDDTAPEFLIFDDGVLRNERSNPEFTKINAELAERTYDESGNYATRGWQMFAEGNDTTSHLTLVVEEGKAYVRGNKVEKRQSTRIQIPKSLETKNVYREINSYDPSERRVRVGSRYVDQIDLVLGESETPSNGIEMGKGAQDGMDALPTQYTSIHPDTVQVWTPVSGSDSSIQTEYQYDRDFRVRVEDGRSYINWGTGNLNGTQPQQGSTYRVYMVYDRQMQQDTDYRITVEESEEEIGWDTYVDFNGMSGAKPRTDGLVTVDYSFYLSRQDRVILDEEGNILVMQGEPDIESQCSPPQHEDPFTLSIGTLLLYPNSDRAKATRNVVMNMPFEDIQRMKRMVDMNTYNIAIRSLEEQQSSAYDPLEVRGQLVDPFMDMTRVDVSRSTVAFSFEDGQITLPIEVPDDQKKKPNMNMNDSTATSWGRLVTAPYTENREIYQPVVSEAWNVNPYNVFAQSGQLKLDPSGDNWIEESKVTVTQDTEPETIRVQRWWGHPDRDPNAQTEWVMNNVNFDDPDVDMGTGSGLGGWSRDNTADRNQQTGTAIRDGGQRTKEEMIEYIRQRDIEFEVSNLLPNVNNMYMSFDGVRVPVEPRNGTLAGSETGTIRTDSKGKAYGKFHIPSGIRTGTRELVFENESENMNGKNIATATYTAHGTRKIVEDVILRTRVTAVPWDPLAQAFLFRNDRVVTSVGLYFMSKDDNLPVTVQVRGLSKGGNPNQTIHAETVLDPEDVSVSEDASVETKVHFDDPLMATGGKSYCIVILSNSGMYTMAVAVQGNPLLNNPSDFVNLQPYTDGILFSSSNSVSWTPHNNADLKFGIYTAEFNEEAVMEFDTMTGLSADQIMLMASYLTPRSTGCVWRAKVLLEGESDNTSIDGKPWLPITNYLEQPTGDVVVAVKLQATFKSNRYISPMMALDDMMFVNFLTHTEADYFTRTVDASDSSFNTLNLEYFRVTPSGTSVTPKYSLDGGDTWNEFTTTPEIEQRNQELAKVKYSEQISTDATNTSLKLKLELRSESRLLRPRVQRFMCLFNDAF